MIKKQRLNDINSLAHAMRSPLHVLNMFIKRVGELDLPDDFQNYMDAAERSMDKLMRASHDLEIITKE